MKLIRTFLIILVIFGVLAAFADSQFKKSIRNARVTACAMNMRSLWQISTNYSIQYCPPYRRIRTDFLDLQKGQRPVLTDFRVFFCPLSGEKVRPGYCSYLGPFNNLRLADGREIVAADRPGNHGPGEGGFVLLKTGDIFHAPASDPVWRIIPVPP